MLSNKKKKVRGFDEETGRRSSRDDEALEKKKSGEEVSSCEQHLTACEGGAVTLIKEPPGSALAVTPSPFICPSLPNPSSPTAAAATTLSPKPKKKIQPKLEPSRSSSFNRLSDETLTRSDGKRTNETQAGRFSSRRPPAAPQPASNRQTRM